MVRWEVGGRRKEPIRPFWIFFEPTGHTHSISPLGFLYFVYIFIIQSYVLKIFRGKNYY
jgi:hypothetical protein